MAPGGEAGEDEKKCLLTPMSQSNSTGNLALLQNEQELDVSKSPEPTETPRSPSPQMSMCPLIYSEPALAGLENVNLAPMFAISDTALPQVLFYIFFIFIF